MLNFSQFENGVKDQLEKEADIRGFAQKGVEFGKKFLSSPAGAATTAAGAGGAGSFAVNAGYTVPTVKKEMQQQVEPFKNDLNAVKETIAPIGNAWKQYGQPAIDATKDFGSQIGKGNIGHAISKHPFVAGGAGIGSILSLVLLSKLLGGGEQDDTKNINLNVGGGRSFGGQPIKTNYMNFAPEELQKFSSEWLEKQSNFIGDIRRQAFNAGVSGIVGGRAGAMHAQQQQFDNSEEKGYPHQLEPADPTDLQLKDLLANPKTRAYIENLISHAEHST